MFCRGVTASVQDVEASNRRLRQTPNFERNGNDDVQAGAGNDLIVGDKGDDALRGGEGDDSGKPAQGTTRSPAI